MALFDILTMYKKNYVSAVHRLSNLFVAEEHPDSLKMDELEHCKAHVMHKLVELGLSVDKRDIKDMRHMNRTHEGNYRNMNRTHEGNYRNINHTHEGNYRNMNRSHEGNYRNMNRTHEGNYIHGEPLTRG